MSNNTDRNIVATNLRASTQRLKHCFEGLAAGLLACAALLAGTPSCAQVPAVVSSSQNLLTTTGTIGAGPAVTDACGNVYVNQSGNGGVVEIQAGTGKQIVISANNNGYNNGQGIGIDSTKSNLYFPQPSQWYSSQFSVVPITNCAPGAASNFAANFGSIGNYYYGTAAAIAVDKAGDVFFIPTCCSNGQILEETAAGTAATVQSSWPNAIKSLASDSAGNLYFTDGSANVYLLKAPYTSTAAAVPAVFNSPVGVSFDPQGNLYVADSGSSRIYEIPLENGALNPAHTYALTSISATSSIAVDSAKNLYLSANAGAPQEIRLGSALLPATAVASSSSASVGYVFNAATTPAKITSTAGTSTNTQFAPAAGGCTAGTAYAAGANCSITVNFTAAQVGSQRGALTFSDAAGNALSTTLLSGVGQGAELTSDPGIVSAVGSGFKSPQMTTVDAAGNVYVTDSTANTVTEFAAGSMTGTVISTGSLTLSGPTGVAVDGAGNVFISDTGNNRVVEVPVVNGALSGTKSVALTGGLKSPLGIAVDAAGGLYIADSGNNRLLYAPVQAAIYNLATALVYGTGFSGPSAVTIDPNGNVYVADAGNKAVVEFAGPIGSQAQVTVITGLTSPSALATDASGSLFVVDSGSAAIYRYPSQSGSFGTRQLVSTSVSTPFGIATDVLGNLYVTDPQNAFFGEVARVQTALNFGAVNIKTSAAPLSATVNSSGNQSLVFPNPSYTVSGQTAAGFSVTNDGCGSAGTVTPGSFCTITASFTPPVTELNAEEDLTLHSNAVSGTPQIALIGTGANLQPSTLSLVLTSPAAGTSLTVGTAVTFTATVGTGASTITPGGSVVFLVNGNQVGSVKVSGGKAVLSLPNGLPAGNPDTVTANYTGDSINYNGSTATLLEVVSALSDTVTLAVTTPYTNPNSINDSSANSTGPSIGLTATLTYTSKIIPGGTVSFYSGTSASHTLLGIGSIGASGSASITTTALRAGLTNVVENNSFLSTYSLYAVYSGDASFIGATSNTASVTVVAPPLCAIAGSCSTPTTGATFAISPSNPTITIPASTAGQQTGSATLNLVSYGGYNGVLSFTCSGLPNYATCAPYPGDPTVVPTTANSGVAQTQVQFFINTNVTPTGPSASGLSWVGIGFTAMLLFPILRRRKQGGMASVRTGCALILLLGGTLLSVAGCGSSSGSQFITPSGTSTITVKVNAAQFVAGTTTNATIANDVNTPSFQITLVVK